MTNRDKAISLARQGFNVFPIKAGVKAPPLILGWQLAATTDEATVREWWTQWPDANIGIHCHDLIVLDIDPRKGGNESLLKLELEYDLPATLEVTTPSGGRHIYYHSDVPVPNGVNVYGPGIDIRSHGGYVLGPGSSVDGSAYTVRCSNPIHRAPEWMQIVARIVPPVEKTAPKPITVSEPTAGDRAKDWLASRPLVVKGERNHKGYAAAAQCRDFGLNEADTVALLQTDWQCEPKLDEAELRHVVHSAFMYARNEEPALTATKLFDVVPEAPKDNMLWPVRYANAPSVWNDPYIIKGVLWQRSDAQLFGEMHVGKTFLTLDMATHIAAGRDWMEHKVRASKVLYLAYEGRRGLRELRIPALRRQYPDIAWDTLPFAVVDMAAPLVSEAPVNQNELPGRIRLQDAIKVFATEFKGPPDVICIDTYSRAIGGDASSESLAQKFAAMVGALIDTYGSTVLRIHHPGHKNKDRARGAYAATAGIDTNIRVEPGKVILDKERDSGGGTFGFKLDVVELGKDQDGDTVTTCVVNPAPVQADMALTDLQTQVMRAIEEVADGERSVNKAKVRQAILADGLATKRTFYKALVSLQSANRIKFDSRNIELMYGAGFDDLSDE